MAELTPSRVAALAALRAVREGALAGPALDAATRSLDPRERAWTQELVYGTLRLRGRLDHRLAPLSNRPLERLDADVLDVLRLGAYQLTEMGGVPAYAAVSQSVELTKRAERAAAGFVNGVLQSLRRAGGGSTFPSFESDPVAHLSTWGSHPRWLVERWIGRWGGDAARALVEANNRTPQLYLRLLGDANECLARLRQAGAEVEPVEPAPRAALLADAGPAGGLGDLLDAAPVIVQDPAAGLVVSWADAPAGAVVLDLAAAPGGKALALAYDAAETAAAPALVVAADVSAERLARVVANLARLARVAWQEARSRAVTPVVADGRRPPFLPADLVLLDAPCTGTGTLRRHPDGRWRLRPQDLRTLARLQAGLLDAAAALVRTDGLLVYATCSLEPEENEEQVSAFLARHPEFRIEAGPLTGGVVRPDGLLEVLPHVHGWDGAFAARLRRKG